ncbi:MAG: DUF1501 domain-containing protein [Gammaproteobacteria bacterium]|nr:DUF1501 domain-containing protein [Gammaproteobacteria bacterium]
MIKRRDFLKHSVAASALFGLQSRLAFARAQTDSRFVFVLLRGAMDGLAAVPAYADSAYRKQRGSLAIAKPGSVNGALDMDGFFGLHPSLPELHRMYQQKEVIVAHAVASSYRERSHFDAQKQLENGTGCPLGAKDGWLNRALTNLSGSSMDAIALSQNIPLVLHGDAKVNSWSPAVLPEADSDTLARIARMYERDDFFFEQFESALKTRAMAGEPDKSGMTGRRMGRGKQSMDAFVRASGRFLQDEDGPRIAVLESNGWDTHANQGAHTGQLANKFSQLDANLALLKKELGKVWENTVVVVVSEFGRTVAVNGSNGSDHGTAGAAFILGGAVNGGRVVADWPGLGNSNLYQRRDLKPTLDVRAIFKSVLHDHLQISTKVLNKTVFPDSDRVTGLRDIIIA